MLDRYAYTSDDGSDTAAEAWRFYGCCVHYRRELMTELVQAQGGMDRFDFDSWRSDLERVQLDVEFLLKLIDGGGLEEAFRFRRFFKMRCDRALTELEVLSDDEAE